MMTLRSVRRMASLAFIIVICGPICIFLSQLSRGLFSKEKSRRFLYRLLHRSLGIKKLIINGEPAAYRPLVLMANHISYADIVVLGSFLECVFVSKNDVRKWPFIGWIAEHYGTVFISRSTRSVKEGLDQLHAALQKGKAVVLFPEGTTGDGCKLMVFKSSYFQLPEDTFVQPVSLRYSGHNGLPATRFIQKRLSWRGAVDLLSHLQEVLQIRRIHATITFHPPVSCKGTERKELTQECYQWVKKGFETA
jgi:1-acyl-sn-glycerol-3-phosphate acyltransferase